MPQKDPIGRFPPRQRAGWIKRLFHKMWDYIRNPSFLGAVMRLVVVLLELIRYGKRFF